MTVDLKLGKKPVTRTARRANLFHLDKYVDTARLPITPPRHFGHEDLVVEPWQMMANDRYGDCVLAGAAHETMLWNHMAGRTLDFNDETVLADYSDVTGFDRFDPATDQGTDMIEAASYRRQVGIRDARGGRHKIAAYLAISPGDIRQLYQALYLFGAVGIGIEFPATAFDQYMAHQTWSVRGTPPIEGGHYIPLVAKRTHLECVTWGRIQPMTVGFFQKYCDEALAYVSLESLTNNVSPEGFDSAALLADLAQLH